MADGMKCAFKGCKEVAVYVLIDGYMNDDKGTLHRREIMVFPMCIKHDGMFHDFIDKAKSNRKLAMTIPITEEEM